MSTDSGDKPGPPPVPPSLARHHRKVAKVRQIMASLIITILCAAAAVAIMGILSEEIIGALLVKLFYTGCISLGYASISYAYLSKSLKSTSVSTNLYGVTIGGIISLILIIVLWVDLDPEIYIKIVLTVLVALVAAVNIVGMAGLGIAPVHTWIRQSSYFLSVLTAVATSYLIFEEPEESDPWRYTGVLLVLTVLGTAVSWILSRLFTEVPNTNLLGKMMGGGESSDVRPTPPPTPESRRRAEASEEPAEKQIRFKCPHCDQPFNASSRLIGTHVECVGCEKFITVPEASEEGV